MVKKSGAMLAAACLCLLSGSATATAGESDYSTDEIFQSVEDFARSMLGMDENPTDNAVQEDEAATTDMAPMDANADADPNADASGEAAVEDSMMDDTKLKGPPVVAKAGGG
ncbi:MAG: hypothetical protein COS82_04285 [Zetaproteobacteria bacterium CG06_land_8_20_14_3_00_59_53]|nr:MAG: hypothetical protein COX56_10390 [Zetaproteobacteria bacterium CG23_combo_of_CG06-09_8_20_14_all_59_86]PIQ65158.1 MAG: hypothetical protein COV97_04975 [Zetaproteobacteria bacterium CG11_big_fil_rev_8_21_14_0_20_59_439]PIU70737.1 MAG: hypothetical protein COS82_04285 [Zetaproteobacteria bacterium CG06_land_8_20_14_3_00_59_53]PIU96407.1 MAG: hypothetical protein COS62_08620 [Zetaproteobacteria bacterium CG03_land_8_20_14_0_80_59_51]PIY45280.1 MAG: hypothetical protein COZ02_09470 [Zetapr